MELVFTHVAAIDVHKRQVTVAVRTPAADGGRAQQVRRYPTFYGALQEMAAWFASCGVTHVAMEATGVYWRPVWHALMEGERF